MVTVLLALLAHAAINLHNDVGDALGGSDAVNHGRIGPFTGGSRAIQDGVFSLSEVQDAVKVLAGVVVVGGILLAARVGPALLFLGLAGLALGWAYSSPKVGLMNRGWGELSVALAWWAVVWGPTWCSGISSAPWRRSRASASGSWWRRCCGWPSSRTLKLMPKSASTPWWCVGGLRWALWSTRGRLQRPSVGGCLVVGGLAAQYGLVGAGLCATVSMGGCAVMAPPPSTSAAAMGLAMHSGGGRAARRIDDHRLCGHCPIALRDGLAEIAWRHADPCCNAA
ncbi:UbiA prenyltransferase family protein [Ideonella paludis]|uniref:hypothetical protein n=1 Tax=Ideonella paludis TaxID=1233411 RepID=UPI00363C3EE5